MNRKINKRQKLILKVAATCLFAIALILILDLVFNGSKSKISNKYVGTWEIGYAFYEGETEDNLLYTFVQELHLLKDGTFYTKEIKTLDDDTESNYVSGTYETSNNKVTLNYEQSGEKKSNILTLNDNRLCLDTSCNTYYTLDKIEGYFVMYNASLSSEE
jgi:hypothetical protein